MDVKKMSMISNHTFKLHDCDVSKRSFVRKTYKEYHLNLLISFSSITNYFKMIIWLWYWSGLSESITAIFFIFTISWQCQMKNKFELSCTPVSIVNTMRLMSHLRLLFSHRWEEDHIFRSLFVEYILKRDSEEEYHIHEWV